MLLIVLQTDKRECILSVALEHGLVGFITACISQWTTAGNNITHCLSFTHTHTSQPFYGSLDFVRDNPGEPVPEETFTHSHPLWSSNIAIVYH